MIKTRRWLVCSAWPYINYVPHLGTMIGSVLSADVFARYLRLRGDEVVFVSGSDEHGTPIEVEAIKRGIPPRKLTDEMHQKVKEIFDDWGITFDNYTRTESPTHKEFIQRFYMKIYENGHIFSEEIEMLYCPKCKRFLPDRFVEGECPYCGYENARGDQCENCGRLLDPVELKSPRCAICGSTPEVKKTTHWFFDLPKFEEDLKKYVEGNKQLPENARNFSLNLLKEGLRPRSLTRDNEWGIPAPFPGAEKKTIYVWMEAVLGYVSATIEWAKNIGKPDEWKKYWFDPQTKSVYFIAKDNIPFHVLILPALLMASGERYNLPWNVASTEFLLFAGKPFSKSKRWGVWADEALEKYPADYWRYYLISIRPETKDSSFTWEDFQAKINNELVDILGNFVHRTLTFIYKRFDGRVPERHEFTEVDKEIIASIQETPDVVAGFLERFKFKDALSEVMKLARRGNKYLNDKAPWHKIKSDKEDAETTLYLCCQLTRSLAILMEPFIPFTSEKIWEMLNLKGSVHDRGNWQTAKELAIPPGHPIKKPYPLFQKILEIEKQT